MQEVIEHLKFKIKTGTFSIKLVRTPNRHSVVSTNPLVCKGVDFVHCVYVMVDNGYGKKMNFMYNPSFPDSQEGFDRAKKLFDSQLAEFHKMKNHSPKRWPMFKKK